MILSLRRSNMLRVRQNVNRHHGRSNNMNMIAGSAEHEEYKQQVLEQHEAAAVAKFTALIPTFTDNIDAALDVLTSLQAVRGLTPCEKRIMGSLITLSSCRLGASFFNREALNKV